MTSCYVRLSVSINQDGIDTLLTGDEEAYTGRRTPRSVQSGTRVD